MDRHTCSDRRGRKTSETLACTVFKQAKLSPAGIQQLASSVCWVPCVWKRPTGWVSMLVCVSEVIVFVREREKRKDFVYNMQATDHLSAVTKTVGRSAWSTFLAFDLCYACL
ncbi:hypothetical protein H107_03511 [Trichophyton rubrum CBS 202.88]|nr:hypothetical protein H107_03511 [Trichophyton rubrum CBS 202.88]